MAEKVENVTRVTIPASLIEMATEAMTESERAANASATAVVAHILDQFIRDRRAAVQQP